MVLYQGTAKGREEFFQTKARRTAFSQRNCAEPEAIGFFSRSIPAPSRLNPRPRVGENCLGFHYPVQGKVSTSKDDESFIVETAPLASVVTRDLQSFPRPRRHRPHLDRRFGHEWQLERGWQLDRRRCTRRRRRFELLGVRSAKDEQHE